MKLDEKNFLLLADDDKSSLFSHDQRLAQGEENYESYIIRYF